MTQWVKKSSRYEPRFTDATDQWCLHYGIMPDVCRVRKPRDKGPVEGLVNKLYQFIYARIRNEVFYTLDSLNSRILELLDEFNCKDIKRKGISRRDIYMREEKPLMNVLPLTPYRFRYQKEFTISSNYHVLVGSEQHSYSIPYHYVGKPAKVLWDMDTVEVYVAAERIVIHKRNFAAYGYTTLENHMPANHIAYKRTKEYNASAIQARALYIGQATKWAVDSLLASRNFSSTVLQNLPRDLLPSFKIWLEARRECLLNHTLRIFRFYADHAQKYTPKESGSESNRNNLHNASEHTSKMRAGI